MSSVADKGTIQERPPFDVAWETIDGLKVRYATGGNSGERAVCEGSAAVRSLNEHLTFERR